jgi:hypothetical protein
MQEILSIIFSVSFASLSSHVIVLLLFRSHRSFRSNTRISKNTRQNPSWNRQVNLKKMPIIWRLCLLFPLDPRGHEQSFQAKTIGISHLHHCICVWPFSYSSLQDKVRLPLVVFCFLCSCFCFLFPEGEAVVTRGKTEILSRLLFSLWVFHSIVVYNPHVCCLNLFLFLGENENKHLHEQVNRPQSWRQHLIQEFNLWNLQDRRRQGLT